MSFLDQIPTASRCHVVLMDGESFDGTFDGAFINDRTQRVVGAQWVTDPPFGVRYVAKGKISTVEVA